MQLARLVKFWNWLPPLQFSNAIKEAIFNALLIIPLSDHRVVSLQSPIFGCTGVSDELEKALKILGLNFIDKRLATPQQSILASSHLHSVFSIPSVLNHICIDKDLSEDVVSTLRKYLDSNLPLAPSLTESQKTKALQLPIYRVISPMSTDSMSNRSNITIAQLSTVNPIRSIHDYILLPEITGFQFVTIADYGILRYLKPDTLQLTEDQTICLAIDSLPNQQRFRVQNFIKFVHLRKDGITPSTKQRLARTKFVISGQGKTLESPNTLLEPRCKAAALFSPDDWCIPFDENGVIDALSSLGVFKKELSLDMAEERLDFISKEPVSQARYKLSKLLLSLLQTPSFDLKLLKGIALPWIPTADGRVVSIKECYNSSKHSLSLFDRVTGAVTADIPISDPFCRLVGWDVPVPFQVVMEQFKVTVADTTNESKKRRDLLILFPELASRTAELSEEEEENLRRLCESELIVPIFPQGLSISAHAVFNSPFSLTSGVPFRVVDQSIHSIKQFLCRLGCQNA